MKGRAASVRSTCYAALLVEPYRVSPMLYVTSLPQRSLRLRATDRWSAPSSWIPSTASRPSTNTELKAPPPPRRPHVCDSSQLLAAQHANMRNGAKKRPAATTHRCPQGSPVSLVTTSSDSVSHTHARERESLHITDERSSVKTIRAAAERNEATAATGDVRLSPDVCAARAGVIVRAAKRHRRTPSPAHPPISAAPRGRGALTRRNKLAIRRKKARRHT